MPASSAESCSRSGTSRSRTSNGSGTSIPSTGSRLTAGAATRDRGRARYSAASAGGATESHASTSASRRAAIGTVFISTSTAAYPSKWEMVKNPGVGRWSTASLSSRSATDTARISALGRRLVTEALEVGLAERPLPGERLRLLAVVDEPGAAAVPLADGDLRQPGHDPLDVAERRHGRHVMRDRDAGGRRDAALPRRARQLPPSGHEHLSRVRRPRHAHVRRFRGFLARAPAGARRCAEHRRSCWPTTSATPTSGATAVRSTRRTSTRWRGAGSRPRTSTSTPMCSPTRAALLTGCEPHRAGLGTVAHCDPGFPGYASSSRPTS